MEGTAASVRLDRRHWGYLIGQCANVAKVAVWWTALSPLILAVTNRDTSVGLVRMAFNIAMLLISPIAGITAERTSLKKLLVVTTIGRGIIWGVLLPLVWVVFMSGLIDVPGVATGEVIWPEVALVFLGVLDGIQVAFSNIADIDMGGVDLLSQQYGIEVNDRVRTKMNAVHQIVFDLCMCLFAPSMAGLSWYLGTQIIHDDKSASSSSRAASGGIVGVFGGVFVIMSIVSLFFYVTYIRKSGDDSTKDDYDCGEDTTSAVVGVSYEGTGSDRLADMASEELGSDDVGDDTAGSKGACASIPALWGDIKDGAALCWRNKPIRWRLIFLALETALEDSMVAVLIAEYALNSELFGDRDPLIGNIWTAAIIAVGKIGAIIAGSLMHRYWTPERIGYRLLFVSVLLGGVSTVFFGISHEIAFANGDPASGVCNLAKGLVFLGAFLFFLFLNCAQDRLRDAFAKHGAKRRR